MKPNILFGFSILFIFILISAVVISNTKNEVPENHVEVVLREIGHQLLLTAKDSSSRVLPIKKISDNKYQVSFQNNLGFISDSLINVVQRTFQNNAIANDYIVNLRSCKANETVLAFEINNNGRDLTPCKGRKLDMGCYMIEIDLIQKKTINYHFLWLLMIPLSVVGFYAKGRIGQKGRRDLIVDQNDFIQLGKFKFYPEDSLLKIEDKQIMLSDKETKALKKFEENINQIVEREVLMKEIWEDEGIVVISRNVDVLVSKLRKKLSDDSTLKFVNIHGKGYKLIIE